jgi:PHP family Zn ribbon phosphoesterase
LLTVDRGLVFQQTVRRFAIAVLVMHAKTNRIDDLAPLIPRVLEVLPSLRHGQIVVVERSAP